MLLGKMPIKYIIEKSAVEYGASWRTGSVRIVRGLKVNVIVREDLSLGKESRFDRDGLCYIFHTSGTTRGGKGVGLPVRAKYSSVILHLQDLRERFITLNFPTMNNLFLSAPTFDPSILELNLPFLTGGTLTVLEDRDGSGSHVRSPAHVYSALLSSGATHLFCTPSFFMSFTRKYRLEVLEGRAGNIRSIVLGGERFPVGLKNIGNWKIAVYNIYGTTECSIWALLQEVKQDAVDSEVPLGQCLAHTEMQVRSIDNETVVRSGRGLLFIGGDKRVCFVGDETEPQRMRCTGDIVDVDGNNGSITFVGRADGLENKVSGYRVDLEMIASIVEQCAEVEKCEVLLLSTDDHDEESGVLPQKSMVSFIAAIGREWDDLVEKIRHTIAASLPEYSRPQEYVQVDDMPMTINGKCDREKLRQLYRELSNSRTHRKRKKGAYVPYLKTKVLEILQAVVPNATKSEGEDWWFLLAGGSSLDVARVAQSILETAVDPILGVPQSTENGAWRSEIRQKIQDRLLHRPISALLDYLVSVLEDLASGNTEIHKSGFQKRAKLDQLGSDELSIPTLAQEADLSEVIVLQRGMCWRDEDHSWWLRRIGDVTVQDWRVDLAKCVDASPVISISLSEPLTAVCFIGSHSGHIAAINGFDGSLVWKTQLPDRIESGCSVSNVFPGRVYVGCYDHRIYALDATSGTILSSFETGDVIKATPVEHPWTGSVITASYDGFMYSVKNLGASDKPELEWRYFVGSGIFGTPNMVTDSSGAVSIVICSLKGAVARINEDGEPVWRVELEKPSFASPVVVAFGKDQQGRDDMCILVTTFDGRLSCLSFKDGQTNWSVSTGDPGISSPVVCIAFDTVVIGTSSKRLISFSLATGNVRWTSSLLDDRIFSTPSIALVGENAWILAASVSGKVYIIDAISGEIVGCKMLPGAVFSSPVILIPNIGTESGNGLVVVSGFRMIVGCRDDYVYSFCVDISLFN
ncbi:hypothetical protein BJ742DRAFT_905058 [Cladochytrium replicatum]|nr:hypothetical protein BJ742DRAFT_905058 [Cladochytrium replicatum]